MGDNGRMATLEMAILYEVLPECQSNTWNDHFALSFLPSDSLLPTYNKMSLQSPSPWFNALIFPIRMDNTFDDPETRPTAMKAKVFQWFNMYLIWPNCNHEPI